MVTGRGIRLGAGDIQDGKDDAYDQLPPPDARGRFRLSAAYVAMATRDVATQLSKAGVRLAFVLNTALRPKR